jgi:hypothetical protein
LLLALASVLIAGCSSSSSSSKSNSPPLVERDPCLEAGPAKSVEYDNCVADREASKREALRALFDDTGVYSRQMQIAESDDNTYQPSDFPDTPIPMVYKGSDSISANEKRALPFKIRVTWKYVSVQPTRIPNSHIRDRWRPHRHLTGDMAKQRFCYRSGCHCEYLGRSSPSSHATSCSVQM